MTDHDGEFIEIPNVPLGRAFKRVMARGQQMKATPTTHDSLEDASSSTQQMLSEYGIAPTELSGMIAGLLLMLEESVPEETVASSAAATCLAVGIEYQRDRKHPGLEAAPVDLLPEGGTPLADAWRRVVGYADAAQASIDSNNIGAARAAGRGNDRAHGVAAAYHLDGDDIDRIVMVAFGAFTSAIVNGAHPVDAFASAGVTLLLTGCEVKTNPLEHPPAGVRLETYENEPPVHKREAIRDCLNANPHSPATADAILNALHVAGWKVVPK